MISVVGTIKHLNVVGRCYRLMIENDYGEQINNKVWWRTLLRSKSYNNTSTKYYLLKRLPGKKVIREKMSGIWQFYVT